MTPPSTAPPRRGRRPRTLAALTTTAALVVGGALAPLTATALPAPATASTAVDLDDPSIDWREIVVDGEDVDRRDDGTAFNTFGGFGAVNCNNTGNLLLDYKEENPDAYWRIMHLLFDPDEGAGLMHIKAELGSDTNTSSGTEPATKRTEDEPANVLRGAGFHFIADALTINPDIETEVLRWGEPSWTGTDPVKRYQWYKETIDAAYDTFGVELDWVSPSQNEVRGGSWQAAELDWTVQFAQWLERDAQAEDARFDYRDIKIVALDSYREGDAIAGRILNHPEALDHVDALGYHYDIVGGPNVTALNKEHGMQILYSEAIAPMIDPQYRLHAEPERGGVGGATSAADIADRFINAYRWDGAGEHPGYMTTFLFQPAVSAMYEGTQYSPKHLIRASDPWSGYWEGGIGISTVRHFHQFIDHGWEYIEGATRGDGTKGDGGTLVDTSTRTVMTARTPAADDGAPDFSQVHANNTADDRWFEVKVANLGEARTLHAWQTRGPDDGQVYDANHFQQVGGLDPVRSETIEGTDHHVYRVHVEPYSILTLSTLENGVRGVTEEYTPGDFAPEAQDEILALPYGDDFEYSDYPTTVVGGTEMSYVERRGGAARYTADQNGAFEVVETSGARGNVLQQQNHAENRGFTWNVWGDGTQDNPSTAAPTTVLGEHRWANYTASVDFRLDLVERDPGLDNFAGLGVRQLYARGGDQATYAAHVHDDGSWQLRRLDVPVAEGVIEDFDPESWHTLSVEARENVITASVDGEELATYVDAGANPVMTGRISLVSGYYNTRYDDLEVTPIDGYAWASEKIDDSDPRIEYPDGATFSQSGFAHDNRTRHLVATGQSVRFDLDGTGFDLYGETGQATIEVQVDDRAPRTEQVGATGARQTSYWLRGLPQGEHTVTVRVVSGTLGLDGVDLLTGGAEVPEVPDEERPVAVAEPVARSVVVAGQAVGLPETVRATSAAGTTIDAEVDWLVRPADFDTAYAMVTVQGTFVNDPSLRVSTVVEVVPEGVVYFVDAAAPLVPTAEAYEAVRDHAAATGGGLLNDQADAAWSADAGWGRVASYGVKAPVGTSPYDKTRETGYYSSGTGQAIEYRLSLDAGSYEVSSGHTEWWNPGSGRSRDLATSVTWTTAGGDEQTVPLGTASFPNGSNGRSAVISGTLDLPEDAVVTFSVAADGGTEAPVLSWLAVAGEPQAGPTVSVSAEPRCVGKRVMVAVRAVNESDGPVDLLLETAFGSREVTGVEPGDSGYQSFATRSAQVDAGSVSVTATDDAGRSVEVDADHEAADCS
ncbi:hypothetical protein GCM10009718_18300 [Isoptericola halotolerans]|uniref:Glycosyl hydrolase family 59 catalytic domain-containing protein n=1 Tax=Isoptericola halotolerans TaxID=300560 RepID=A0ABX2A990_9MICO|nr:hypothetical protein [Isoptericola halotolerans]NOV98583.1 hypothetical protein [Isoptericola halotolerans]